MKASRLGIIIIFILGHNVQALSQEHNHLQWLFHQLITIKLPQLDTAITSCLDGQPEPNSRVALDKTTFAVYQHWHQQFSSTQNTSLPASAVLLHKTLHPTGFQFHLNTPKLINNPIDETLPAREQIIMRLLQIIAEASNHNVDLKPLLDELLELFECSNLHCLHAALPELESGDAPITPEQEQMLKIYINCIDSKNSFFSLQQTHLCNDLLILPSPE